MFFSDLFLSSSTNRRFLEVGSFLQLYIIIVGPSFFRQRVVVYKELLSMIFMHQRATSFETRGKHGKSRRVACPRRKTLHFWEYTLSENNVPTNAGTILIHTTFLSWQKFCNRGLISFKKRASSSLFFYWYIMKFNKAQIWLVKKRALWEYKHGAKRFFF